MGYPIRPHIPYEPNEEGITGYQMGSQKGWCQNGHMPFCHEPIAGYLRTNPRGSMVRDGVQKGAILGVPFRPLFRVVIADALFKRVTSHPYILPSGWIWG